MVFDHAPVNKGIKFLRVEMQNNWKAGDLIAITVPPKIPQAPVAVELRQLYVEVPDDNIQQFFVRFYEDLETGRPVLDYGACTTRELSPLVATPIIAVDSAMCKRKRNFLNKGFLHLALLWEFVLPVAVYFGLLVIAHFAVYDQHDMGMVILWHLPALFVGYACMWMRFRKSILFPEVCYQTLIACVMMFVVIYLNTGADVIIYRIFGYDWSTETSLPSGADRDGASITAEYLADGVVGPIIEEVAKFMVVRFVAYRAVVVSPDSLLAYAAISGIIFCTAENILYMSRHYNDRVYQRSLPGVTPVAWDYMRTDDEWDEHRLGHYSTRAWICLMHIFLVAASCARLARLRFIGTDWKWAPKFGLLWCVYPSILFHMFWNIWVTTQQVTDNANLPEDEQWLPEWAMILVRFSFLIACAIYCRWMIYKVEKVPRVDVHELRKDGQIAYRSPKQFFTDTFMWCSKRNRGLWRGNKKERRPIIQDDGIKNGFYTNPADAYQVCNARNRPEFYTSQRYPSPVLPRQERARVAREQRIQPLPGNATHFGGDNFRNSLAETHTSAESQYAPNQYSSSIPNAVNRPPRAQAPTRSPNNYASSQAVSNILSANNTYQARNNNANTTSPAARNVVAATTRGDSAHGVQYHQNVNPATLNASGATRAPSAPSFYRSATR